MDRVKGGAEFIFGAALEIQVDRHDADPFWQKTDKFFQGPRTMSRFDHANDTTPTGENHKLVPIAPAVPVVPNVSEASLSGTLLKRWNSFRYLKILANFAFIFVR